MLGNAFCSKMLSWYILEGRGIMTHLEIDGEILGYCGGIITKAPGLPGAATSITQYSLKVFIRSFALRPWLIFHIENLKRIAFIFKNILIKLGIKKSGQIKTNEEFNPRWGIVVIGLVPNMQGKGFGSALLQDFEKRAKLDQVNELSLSVKKNNKKAIQSYERNGWIIKQSDKNSHSMIKKI
jgi:ribosomal protein S18 acetylase RimI-like enzyme